MKKVSNSFFTSIKNGLMREQIENFDWAQTELGVINDWPDPLVSAVRLLLNSRYPMFVWWGENQINIYNDAYIPVLGSRHPKALGSSAREVWSEIWPIVGAQAEIVMKEGRATLSESLLLVMERHGFKEETYFSYSYSPIQDYSGNVQGLFCVCNEDTQRVINDRQLALLFDLAGSTHDVQSWREACKRSTLALSKNQLDLLFTLIYIKEPKENFYSLTCASGISFGDEAAPEIIEPAKDDVWLFNEFSSGEDLYIIDNLKENFQGALPVGGWSVPSSKVALIPLSLFSPLGEGYLIVGLNPYRPLDDQYRSFLKLLGNQISSSINSGLAFEEEKKRAEVLAELDKAKTVFFSNVSHEFRTPLTLMLGPIDDLLSQENYYKEEELRKDLELIQRNSLRMLKLVNSMLDFSRLESGRIQASFEPIDLVEYTAGLASIFRSAIERAGLTLHVDCQPLPEPVFVDPDMWEKIVLNLLSNALKFTLAGEIELRLEAANNQVQLTVRDTGIGIAPENIDSIFERFQRVEDHRGRSNEGTGIGLALVKELTNLHGGHVTVESEVDSGTEFVVTIPFGHAHHDPARIKKTSEQTFESKTAEAFLQETLRWLPDTNTNQEKQWIQEQLALTNQGLFQEEMETGGDQPLIFLADDNADMRQYIRQLLERRYEVVTFSDGISALEAAKTRNPNLIISDVMMPRLDGFELVKKVRANPAINKTPVILISARAGEESRIEGIEIGADDYLVKPFSARELLARVETQLEMAQLRFQSNKALQNSEARFKSLAEAVPAIVWVCNPDGSLVFLNQHWMEYTGQTQEEYRGFGWAKTLHPDEAAEVLALWKTSVRTGDLFEHEVRYRRRDGAYRWHYVHGMPMYDENGDIQLWYGAGIDIHERIVAEKSLYDINQTLEERIELRTKQVRQLSHKLTMAEQQERHRISQILHDDLQQLLIAAMMNIASIAKDIDELEEKKFNTQLEESQEILKRSVKITRQLTVDISPPILEKEGLVDSLLWLASQMADLHRLDVEIEAKHNWIIEDKNMLILLFQIVRELLLNVIKHAEVDKAVVKLFEEDDFLVIHVIDEGKGFDPDTILTDVGFESGFGLFSVNERLEALDGRLEIISQPGEGTTVKVYTLVQSVIKKESKEN